MKNIIKRSLSLLMSLVILLSLVSGISLDFVIRAQASDQTAEEASDGNWFYLSDFSPVESVTTGWNQTDYLAINAGITEGTPELYLCTEKATSADNAVKFSKGMSIQAPGKITYDISDMNATRFTCLYGTNAKHGSGLGSVGLKIYTDKNASGEYLYCLNSAEDAARLGVESYPIGQYDKAVEIDIEIPKGATMLYLEPTNGGNGNDSDHAVFAEPKLYADYTYLSNMEYTEVSAGWGNVCLDKSFEGPITFNTLYKGSSNGVTRVYSVECDEGICIHAPSSVTYDIEGMGVERFTSFCGISTNSGNHNPTSTFKVFFDGVEVHSINKTRNDANIAIGENIDLQVPEGTKTITLTAQAVGSNDGNHTCWAYPRLFGDNLDKTDTHEHTCKAVVTAPTCSAQGYTSQVCATCDEVVSVGDYVDAVCHSFDEEAGVCVYGCGTKATDAAGIYQDGLWVASYASVNEAIKAYDSGIVKLYQNSDEAVVISSDLTIDLAGYTLSNVTVSAGSLKLVDSAATYEAAAGSAAVTGTVETFTEANGKTYLVVGENGVYAAHSYDVALTHISLNPAKDALGYKAKLYGDTVVQAQVNNFGFNMWVDGGQVRTYGKTGTDVLTLRLQNILAANGGEMNINATAFVTLAVGEQTTTKICAQQTTTMKETLQAVDSAWDSYTETQQTAVKALCDQYYDAVSDWELYNIYPRLAPMTIYKAEEGYTANGVTLNFKENVDMYFMYNNSTYSGMNLVDNPDTVLTETEVWGTSGAIHAYPTTSGASGSAVVNFGDTSGARVYAKTGGSAAPVLNLMMPWKIREGQSFEYSANIKLILNGGGSRWIALTVGNKLNEDGTKIPQQYQLVTRINGTQAGLTKGVYGDTIAWTNYTHNNGKQAPLETLDALTDGQTYEFKVVGQYITVDGQETYAISSYLDGKTIMENYVIDESEVAGYLGIECSGIIMEIDYDDTVVSKRDTTGYTQYKIDEQTDFSGAKRYDLASGSYQEASIPVQYGYTGFKGTASGTSNLVLPYQVGEQDDVVFTVPITITEADGNDDYVSLTFGNMMLNAAGELVSGDDISSATTIDALYHCAMRKKGYNAALSRWDGGWQDLINEDRVSGIVPLVAGKTYVFEIVITDGHILDYYIDDNAILRDFDLNDLENWTKSSFNTGFPTNAAGYLGIQFKSLSIEVAYSEPEGQYTQSIYQANSDLINEAVVAWDSDSTYADVLAANAAPAQFAFRVDNDLNCTAADGTSIPMALEKLCVALYEADMIPLIYVDDVSQAEALTTFLTDKCFRDVMVISSDISALNYVLTNTDGVKGVYDASAEQKTYTAEERTSLMHMVNQNQVKVIVLSEASADVDTVTWLQNRMMTVWARSTNAELSNLNLLTAGVDGIITGAYQNVYSDMEAFSGSNVHLRMPAVIGHRGSRVGADGSVIPEVTVDALIQAAQFGADAVESDIHCTADGVLVLHHDTTTNRMMTNDLTAGTGEYSYTIADETYQTLYDNLIYKADYSKDKDGNLVVRHIDTLEDQFKAFSAGGAAENKDVVLVLEFKNSTKTICVDEVLDDAGNLLYYTYNANGSLTIPVNTYSAYELKRLSQKYDVEAQCIVISFDTGFLAAMNQYYPQMSAGYLMGGNYDDVAAIMNCVEAWNGSYHPYSAPSNATLRGSYARGIVTNPWQNGFSAVCSSYASDNVRSVNTNDTIYTAAWAQHISVASRMITVQGTDAFDLGVCVLDQCGAAVENASIEVVTISGNGITAQADGSYSVNDGNTVVMAKYVATTAEGYTFTLYSQPITITVQATA